jgi:hypothetical protein
MARQSMLILVALMGAFCWATAPAARAGSDDDDKEFVWVVYSSDSPGGKIMGADYPTEQRANDVAKIRRETLGLNDQHLYFHVSVKREPKNKSFQPGGGRKTDPGDPVGLPSAPRPSGKAKIIIHVTKIVDGEPEEQTSLYYETDSDWDGASKYYWEKSKAGYLVSWKGTGAWKNPKPNLVTGASAASADPGGPYNPPSDVKVQPGKKSGSDDKAPKAGLSDGEKELIGRWRYQYKNSSFYTTAVVDYRPDGTGTSTTTEGNTLDFKETTETKHFKWSLKDGMLRQCQTIT